MNVKLLNVMIGLCLAGIIYIIYYQQIYLPQKLEKCFDTAVNAQQRENQYRVQQGGSPIINDGDVSDYLKNITFCLSQ